MVIGSLVFLNNSVLAQSIDPQGWDKAKWGMTEKEISEIFKGEVKERPKKGDHDSNLYIPKLKLGVHAKYDVSFLMDKNTKRLKQINMIARICEPGTDKEMATVSLSDFDARDLVVKAVVQELEEMLILKYGNPTYSGEKEGVRIQGQSTNISRKKIWKCQTTEIELSSLSPGVYVILIYRQKKDQERL